DSIPHIERHFVQLRPDLIENIALDTAYVDKTGSESKELILGLTGTKGVKTVPVSLYNGDKLIAKSAANFNNDQKSEVSFTLPSKEMINGKLEISEPGLDYDNRLFLNINKKEKIKVMAVSEEEDGFLKRIYTDDYFQFRSFSPTTLNYSLLDNQNLVVLNGLEQIPATLRTALVSFKKNGGSIVVIPSNTIDLNSYNQFLANFRGTSLIQKKDQELEITTIAFSHPIFDHVFEKRTTN